MLWDRGRVCAREITGGLWRGEEPEGAHSTDADAVTAAFEAKGASGTRRMDVFLFFPRLQERQGRAVCGSRHLLERVFGKERRQPRGSLAQNEPGLAGAELELSFKYIEQAAVKMDSKGRY